MWSIFKNRTSKIMKHAKTTLALIFLLSLSNACNNFCQEYLNTVYRPLEYKMVVTDKYIDTRFYRIIGQEQSGIIDTTEESAIDEDEYKLIEIGDTLLKERNKLILSIIKKDTTYKIPQFCK